MIAGKGTISLSLQTAISASSQSQVGATIVKGVVAAGKAISTIDPFTGALIVEGAACVAALVAAMENSEPMEFDDVEDMCAYYDAHRL